MNSKYRELNSDYEKQQMFVVTEIIQIAHGYVPYISEIGHLCSKLDCLVKYIGRIPRLRQFYIFTTLGQFFGCFSQWPNTIRQT